MRAVRITDPLWVGNLGPAFKRFVDRVPVVGITYESFHTYLTNSVQLGGHATELWVILDDDNKPMAFAHWLVRGLPHVGKTYCDFIFNWSRKRKPMEMLLEKWIEFGTKFRCRLFEGEATNDKLFQHFSNIAKDNGYVIKNNGRTNFVAWKDTSVKEEVAEETTETSEE